MIEIQEVEKIPDHLHGRGGRNKGFSAYKDLEQKLISMNGFPLKVTLDDWGKYKGIARFIYSRINENYRFKVASDKPNKTIYISKINRKETKNV